MVACEGHDNEKTWRVRGGVDFELRVRAGVELGSGLAFCRPSSIFLCSL